MKISWSLVILVLLGLTAAFSAALLTTTIQVQANRKASELVPANVEVLVAGDEIKAWTQINPSLLEKRTIPRLQAPSGYLSDESLVVGKRILVDTVAGQVLTAGLFPTGGTGLALAGQLPEGARAVTIALKGESGLEGLIYPGCQVDVIATFNLDNNSMLGEAVSTTLLENIRVLAVEDVLVGENAESTLASADEAAARRATGTRGMFITLLVDTKQAEALQLAVDRGSVSLAMRNPVDSKPGDATATLLNQGRLAEYAGSLDANVPGEENMAELMMVSTSNEEAVEPEPEPEIVPEPKPEPRWTVDIIRGISREVRELKLPVFR